MRLRHFQPRRLASSLTVGLLALAACAPANAPSQGQPSDAQGKTDNSTPAVLTGRPASAPGVPGPTTSSPPKSGGSVIVGDTADVKTLNPVLVGDLASDIV